MDEICLSVIIVTHNSARDILPCLSSIYGDPSPNAQVIVVDNASTDATVSLVRNHFPQVLALPLPDNRGFAAANNVGLQHSHGLYVMLINPDTIVSPGAVSAMIGALDGRPQAGIVGPRLLNPDGSLQPSIREFPSLLGDIIGMTEIYRIHCVRRLLGGWRLSLGDHSLACEVDWLSGACLLARSKAIASVGPLDEGYYMYSEELDWQYRMRRAGWRIWFDPSAEVVHIGGTSTSRAGGERIVWQYRSMLRFYRIHRGSFRAGLQRALVWGFTWPKILVLAVTQFRARDRRESLCAFWRVLWTK